MLVFPSLQHTTGDICLGTWLAYQSTENEGDKSRVKRRSVILNQKNKKRAYSKVKYAPVSLFAGCVNRQRCDVT